MTLGRARGRPLAVGRPGRPACPTVTPRCPSRSGLEDLLARMTLDEKLAQLGSLWSFEVFDGRRPRPGASAASAWRTASARSRASWAPPTCRPGRSPPSANADPALPRRGDPAGHPGHRPRGEPARRHGRRRDLLPAVDRAGGHLGRRRSSRRWRASSGDRLRAMGASQALAPVLDITPRPALGSPRGDLRRGPVPGGRAGRAPTCAASRRRDDGRRPRHRHGQAHGRPRRPGGRPQPRPRRTSASASCTTSSCCPFEAAVREAGIGSVMHAYDDLDGVPCVASRELLTTILRERWGFDGIVVADYMGIEHLLTVHEMVADLSDAAGHDAGGRAGHGAAGHERLRPAAARGPRRRPRGRRARGPGRGAHPAREARGSACSSGPTSDDAALEPTCAERDDAGSRSRWPAGPIVLLENDGTLPLRPDLGTHRGHRPERGRRPQPRGRLRAHRAHRDAAREPRPRGRRGLERAARPAAGGRAGLLVRPSSTPSGLVSPPAREIRYAARLRHPGRRGRRASRRRSRRPGARRGHPRPRRTLRPDRAVHLRARRATAASWACPADRPSWSRAVAATGTPIVLVLVSGRPAGHPRGGCPLRQPSSTPGCPARPGRRPSPRSSSATSARAASCP